MSIISSIIDMVSEVVVNDPFFHRSFQFAVQRFYAVLIMGGSASRFVCPRPKRALTHVRIVCCQLAPVGAVAAMIAVFFQCYGVYVFSVMYKPRSFSRRASPPQQRISLRAAAERAALCTPPLVCSPIHISHPTRPNPCGFLCRRATSACMGGGRGVSEP